jgi:hypothetical protein
LAAEAMLVAKAAANTKLRGADAVSVDRLLPARLV